MQSRKSEIKTFRLDTALIEGLRLASRQEEITENALVQRVLWQHIKVDHLAKAIPFIVLSKRSLAAVLETAGSEGLKTVGSSLGRKNFAFARELFESQGEELNFRRYLIEVLDGHAHWFGVGGASKRPERLTLYHELGDKWSLFLKSYLVGAFEVTSKDGIRISTSNSYVSVEIPHSDVQMNAQ